MSLRFLFTSLTVCMIAAAVLAAIFPPGKMGWLCLPLGFGFIFLLLLFRNVMRTVSTATRGMELISAQDFNNRLSKVGEPNADRIVNLFNTLIDKLRNERLKNLEQEGFLRLLIEASPMGVMMLDFNGKISLLNGSMIRLLEIGNENSVIGQDLVSLQSDTAAKMARVPLGENMIIRRGHVGMYRCYHLSFIQTGFSRRFFLLESLTEEVMKAQREAYEKVIRIISHEVNNTMGGVKSVLGLLHDTAEEGDIRDVIDSCDERCDVLCSFINAYADVIKVPEPVRSPVNLGNELSSIMPFLRRMAGDSVMIELSLDCENLIVSLDMSLMQQVVVNIVKNALESMHGEGHITIAAGKNDDSVWMEISNDGEPISEEVSHKLFSPFFTTKKEGRGLGLMLIGDILRNHEARFSLRTGCDGITRFHIDF